MSFLSSKYIVTKSFGTCNNVQVYDADRIGKVAKYMVYWVTLPIIPNTYLTDWELFIYLTIYGI